jgi:hypothetical protein
MFIIFIFIILICIYYFYIINNKEKEILENFNVDINALNNFPINSNNKLTSNKLTSNKLTSNNIEKNINWNGIWVCNDKIRYIYANFEKVNDKLLISISYTSATDIKNILLLRCLLNLDGNIFYITDYVFENNFVNDNIDNKENDQQNKKENNLLDDLLKIFKNDKKDDSPINLYGKMENNEIYIYNYDSLGKKYIKFIKFKDSENSKKKITAIEELFTNTNINKQFWYPELLKDYGWGINNLYDYKNFIINNKIENGHINKNVIYLDFKNYYYLNTFIEQRKNFGELLKTDNLFFFDNILDNNLLIDEVILYYAIGQFPFNFNIDKFNWNHKLLMDYSNINNTVDKFLDRKNMLSFSKKNNINELPVCGFILERRNVTK